MADPKRTPAEALAWAEAQTSWPKGQCLNFVYTAYYDGNQSVLGAQGVALPTARSAWDASEHKVTDGSEPPVGALMYFDGITGDTAGDAQIYIGNHKTRHTDVGTAGVVGTVDWMWMRDTIGHPYLGWTRDVLGYLQFPDTTTEATITQEGIDMSYKDDLRLVQTKWSKKPTIIDTWLVNMAARDYIHMESQTQIDWHKNMGVQAVKGVQASMVLANYTCKDKSGGVR